MRDWRLGSRAFLVRSIGELEVIAFVYIESAVLYTFDSLEEYVSHSTLVDQVSGLTIVPRNDQSFHLNRASRMREIVSNTPSGLWGC